MRSAGRPLLQRGNATAGSRGLSRRKHHCSGVDIQYRFEHQATIDAILAFDQVKAADCARQHIVVQGKRLGDLIASLKLLSAAE